MRVDGAARTDVRLVVPGSLETPTGGYLYDRRILQELETLGFRSSVLSLDDSFPTPTGAALTEAGGRFAVIPDGATVIIDGLALAGLLPLLPGIVRRLRPIALIHHPLADETGIGADLRARLDASERAALACMPRVIVTSPWTRRRLADFGVDAERVVVVEPGVDRPPHRQRRPSGVPTLLTVAAVTPRKGHALLVEALARLGHLDWSLRLAGSLDADPDCAKALEAQISDAGLTHRIRLLGALPPGRIFEEYEHADCFVLPSFLEGFGMALAEAVSHGLPVVSTTAGAIPETVPDTAACLVPPGDVDALTDVLQRLLSDPTALAILAEGARTAVLRTWCEAGRAFAAALAPDLVR